MTTAPQGHPPAICIHRTLLWLLATLLTTTTLGTAVPTPSGQFLSWCSYNYGPGSDVNTPRTNLLVGAHTVSHLLRPPNQAYPTARHPRHLHSLEGVWGPGTSQQLAATPRPFMEQALNRLAAVLQPQLLQVALPTFPAGAGLGV